MSDLNLPSVEFSQTHAAERPQQATHGGRVPRGVPGQSVSASFLQLHQEVPGRVCRHTDITCR